MKKLLVILGAGGSIDFDMPSVNDIDKLFEKWSNFEYPIYNSSNYKNLYSWVKGELVNHGNALLNFESYLHAIQVISSKGKGNYPIEGISCSVKIEDFPKIRSGYSDTHIASKSDFDLLNTFLNDKLLKHMRKKCLGLTLNKAKELQEIKQFFTFLKTEYELGFINLNYDNVLLSAMPELYTGFNIDNNQLELSKIYSDEWSFCYHVHGSVHFDMATSEEEVWNRDLNSKFGLGGPIEEGI